SDGGVGIASLVPSYHLHFFGEISTGFQLHRFDQRSNGFGLTAGRNDEILTRWNLEKILTNRVRGIDSNPRSNLGKRVSWIRISSIIQAYLKDIHITRNEGKTWQQRTIPKRYQWLACL
ncbi:hypothetical protein PSG78_04405, partial [Enterococcus faecium]|uniref:hypothetical protein n=1 Tax=Enterococcus faecium TaxID=1352 RepID=UPI002954CAD1